MSEKTLVLDTQELYQVIPECKALEGQNFKDIKELLMNLVAAIEKSGDWEFMQYVNTKPSLFVIRRVSDNNSSQFEYKKFQEFENMYRDVKNLLAAAKTGDSYVSQPYQGTPIEDIGKPSEVLKNDEMQKTEKAVEENLRETYIPSIKLPWEQ